MPTIKLPQGFYTVYLYLRGEMKNNQEDMSKKNILRKLLYAPQLSLDLSHVVINGVSKHIPNEFGNDKRFDTYISL